MVYSVLLVTAIVLIGTVIDGTGFSFSVFFKYLENDLNMSRAATSAVFSLNIILSSAFGFLGGWALDKYGPRRVLFMMGVFTAISLLLTSRVNSSWQLFMTYSLLLAMGTGPVYAVTNSIVMRTFKKEQGLLIGIANAGEGLGIIVMAPVATLLIASFDWRIAYVIIGLIALVTVIPVSLLVRKTPQEAVAQVEGLKPYTEVNSSENQQECETDLQEGCTLTQAMKTRSFWFFMMIGVLLVSGIHLVFSHLIPHITDMGFSENAAATILSLIGITSIVGGILMGLISDKFGRKPIAFICVLLQVCALAWLIPSDSLWSLYLFASIFGIAFGGVMATLTPMVGETFGIACIGKLMGTLDCSFGIAALAGPLMAGFIYDIRGDYTLAFIITSAAAMVAALLILQIRPEVNSKTAHK
jgi:MFS family permease